MEANVLPQRFTECMCMSYRHTDNAIDGTRISWCVAVVACHDAHSDKGTRPPQGL